MYFKESMKNHKKYTAVSRELSPIEEFLSAGFGQFNSMNCALGKI